MPRRRRSPSSSPSRERGDRRRYKDRRRSRSHSNSRRRRSRSRSDSPPRRRRSRSRSHERSQPESDDENRTKGVDPMAALEAAAAPASAPDPMAALEAAAVKAVPPPGSSAQSVPATPFDFFEAFQRARPDQAAPRCKATASTVASACGVKPATPGRPASEKGSMQARQRGSLADPGCDSVRGSSSPCAVEATADVVEQAHQELDPLARLLVRQSRQVHVRVPRQATAASEDAQPRAEGRRGQPARFAPQYDTQ